MTATIRKMEHQLQPDGNILLHKYEEGQFLPCTMGCCTTTTICCWCWCSLEGPLLTAITAQVQQLFPVEKEVHIAAFDHLQKHKNSMGCLQVESGLCQELSKAVVATGIIGLCQL